MKTKEKPSDSPRLKPPGAVNGGQTGGSDIDSGVLDLMGVGGIMEGSRRKNFLLHQKLNLYTSDQTLNVGFWDYL